MLVKVAGGSSQSMRRIARSAQPRVGALETRQWSLLWELVWA